MAKEAEVLVVTPHPDDAEFGVAGTVARWTREGKKVVYVVTTNGDKGTSDINMKPEVLAKIREKEQLAAAKVLGVSEVVFLGHHDQELEDTREFRKEIVREIRKFRPFTVVTADLYRRYLWHRDHRITARVTLDAIFPYARDLLAYPDLIQEGLQPHKVKEIMLWGSEEPNYFTDVTDTFELKMKALRCHESQVGPKIRPDLEEMLRGRAIEMAKGTGYKLAEAFYRYEILH
jgi:LmbE family N-acetylglucosaminyl deacetylase